MDKQIESAEIGQYGYVSSVLRSLGVGETYTFPLGTNPSSIRPLASVNAIRIKIHPLPSGEIQVTRKPDKKGAPEPVTPEPESEKLYDL